MTTSSHTSGSVQHISGPGDLLQAIPYLLGFHPQQSLVLVGLDCGRLVVTARLDLADVEAASNPRERGPHSTGPHSTGPHSTGPHSTGPHSTGPHSADVLHETIAALFAGGADSFIAAIFTEARASTPSDAAFAHESVLAESVQRAIERAGCRLLDALLVWSGRYRSLVCDSPRCCPPEGLALPVTPSSFAAAATYEGVVALPDRAALESLLDPLGESERQACEPMLRAAWSAAAAAAHDNREKRHARSIKRCLFAEARESSEPGWATPGAEAVARYAIALGEIPTRDALWAAIDSGRLDGRPLWREIARRVPSPHDAPPMFLFGWAAWRSGDGALAGIAAERTVASDPGYSAADLLSAVLARGLDPRQTPRLWPRHSA